MREWHIHGDNGVRVHARVCACARVCVFDLASSAFTRVVKASQLMAAFEDIQRSVVLMRTIHGHHAARQVRKELR